MMTPAPRPTATAPHTFNTVSMPRLFCDSSSHQMAPKEPARPRIPAPKMPRRSAQRRLPMLVFSPVRTMNVPRIDATMPTPAIRKGNTKAGPSLTISPP